MLLLEVWFRMDWEENHANCDLYSYLTI